MKKIKKREEHSEGLEKKIILQNGNLETEISMFHTVTIMDMERVEYTLKIDRKYNIIIRQGLGLQDKNNLCRNKSSGTPHQVQVKDAK